MSIKGKAFFKGELFSFDLPEGWDLLAMAEPKVTPAGSVSLTTTPVASAGPLLVMVRV